MLSFVFTIPDKSDDFFIIIKECEVTWPSEILLFTLYTRISQNQKTCSVFLFIEFSVISTTADSVNAKAFVTC